MNFSRSTLAATHPRSLSWSGDDLVDWVGGHRYHLNGEVEELNPGYSYRFDAAVGCGEYGVGFEALGTKGRLLRDNGQRRQGNVVPLSVDIVRELDRSYYHAEDYWYPVTLFHGSDGQLVLAHCPRGYNVLDLEDIDGRCLTPRPSEGAADVFHSRLQAGTDGRWLLSNGWVWQPWSVVCVYDVNRALEEPAYLSTTGEKVDLGDSWTWDVQAATFAGERVVCATGEESGEKTNALTIFDLRKRTHERTIMLESSPGSRMMALDEDHIILLDKHPRVIELSSGNIVEQWDDLDGGDGLYQPSVRMKPPAAPWIACDPLNSRFAIGHADRIDVIALAR